MTTPEQTGPPGAMAPAAGMKIEVGAKVAQGPDGTFAIYLELTEGAHMHAMLLPLENAERFGAVVTDVLARALELVRRAGSGLVLPNPPTPSGLVLPQSGQPLPRPDARVGN